MKRLVLLTAILGSVAVMAQQPDASAIAIRAAQSFVTARVPFLPAGSSLRAGDVFADGLGQAHVRFQHLYLGLPVFESEAIVHVDLGTETVTGATDALLAFQGVDTRPGLGAGEAHRRALQHFGIGSGLGLGSRDDLVVLVNDGFASLAWQTRAFGDGGQGPVDKIAFVDAHGGGVLRSWDNVQTADTPATGSGKGFFNGTVSLSTDNRGSGFSLPYRLLDLTRGSQITCDMKNTQANCYYMDDLDNAWGDGTLSNRQSVAVDAQYGTAVTFDYYKNVHGRNGIANNGTGAYNRVHYARNYNNAYWSDSCFCMTYGDGDGKTFNPFDSLDVAGHEMSHGVTSRTANLTYSGESGGLNEGNSDIFGTMVEYYANNPNDTPDYLIGEKLYKSGGGTALRYMYQPSLDGKSADCWYSGVGSLNVHYSSGVANHFYYLLAEGTSNGSPSKTCGTTTSGGRVATGNGSLSGIGRTDAQRIWYRALTVYMTPSTTYANARSATVSAATDLFGSSSSQTNAVKAAWSAVNRP